MSSNGSRLSTPKKMKPMPIIQIYAFTSISDALKAVELGVDQVGFVAGKYGQVFGELSFAEGRELVRALPPTARGVALTMSTDMEEILRMAAAIEPAIVHISTDVNAVGLEAMAELRQRLPDTIGLMKAISVEDEGSIEVAKCFAEVSDILLLDTKVHGMPGVGATGHTHDWSISRRIVEAVDIPVILAGGLSAENVGAAMQAVGAWGVDSNTSTNRSGDAVQKDILRIAEFVKAVRLAAAEG